MEHAGSIHAPTQSIWRQKYKTSLCKNIIACHEITEGGDRGGGEGRKWAAVSPDKTGNIFGRNTFIMTGLKNQWHISKSMYAASVRWTRMTLTVPPQTLLPGSGWHSDAAEAWSLVYSGYGAWFILSQNRYGYSFENMLTLFSYCPSLYCGHREAKKIICLLGSPGRGWRVHAASRSH